jgi:GDPmannose 4,6-dehydratase
MPRALIIGITGQAGSYLAEFLLSKGYEVHGMKRRSSSHNTSRIDHVYCDPHNQPCNLILHYGDIDDVSSLSRVLNAFEFDEIYNLSAQSHVRVSFDIPVYTSEVVSIGALKLFETVRHLPYAKRVRIYQAGSSEMFGGTINDCKLDENSPFNPRSPYAVAKVAAFQYATIYRKAYGMFIANGILFNNESVRREETFVTRKITRAATRIKEGLQDKLYLGNMDAKRDWGFTGDYVVAMWLMLQCPLPDDFVIATGVQHSVQQFCDLAFAAAGLKDYADYVAIDPRYFRPLEVDSLIGNAAKAYNALGWQPTVDLDGLVTLMVNHDRELAVEERLVLEHRQGITND